MLNMIQKDDENDLLCIGPSLVDRKLMAAIILLMLKLTKPKLRRCSRPQANSSEVGVISRYLARCQLWCFEMTVPRLDSRVISPNLY